MSLVGHLNLVVAAGADGRTVLRRQSFSAPFHISKPHHDADWLVVNMASPTPGLLSGDRLNVRVAVEPGARLLLTAPSASRIHKMPAGHAELHQEFRVADGGTLDYWPEYLIPQAGSRYRQRSILHVEPGGTLLWTESLAPGRTASGEIFAFSELRIATDLHIGSAHVARERYALTPGDATQRGLLRHFPTPYYASLLCVSPGLATANDGIARLLALHDSSRVWIGASRLIGCAWAVKVIAASSPDLRRAIAAIRTQLYAALTIATPSLRRITGESQKQTVEVLGSGVAVRAAG
ncbi:MAG: urease accessory protein UreD [Chthoniobacteraceae bacterium]